MRRLLTVLFFLCCAISFGATESHIKGWLVVITLNEYKTASDYTTAPGTSVNPPPGTPIYHASYVDNYQVVVKYVFGDVNPTWEMLGTAEGKTLDGQNPPSSPYYFPFSVYLCRSFRAYPMYDDKGIQLPSFTNDERDRYLTPIYKQSLGLPFTTHPDYGYYTGSNPNFQIPNVSDILQGQIYNPQSSPSYTPEGTTTPPQYIYYDSSGQPVFTDSSSGLYQWNVANGQATLVPVDSSSSSGSVDLSPVVNAVNTQGGNIISAVNSDGSALRAKLVELLGASGNSWVYDCKLNTEQLRDLAQEYFPQIKDSINDNWVGFNASLWPSLDDIRNAIVDKDVSPVVNVAAPNVTVNPQVSAPDVNVNVDTSSLATESTLSAFYQMFKNNLASKIGNIYILNSNMNSLLTTIKNTLSSWDNTTAPTISGPSGFEVTDENDGLPNDLKALYGSSSPVNQANTIQRLGDYVSWGDSGAPQVFNLDFLSGFLTSVVGSVPSVGSDANMFEVDFELPYIGRIQRTFRWSDFPYVGEFRMFLVWVLYLFFGLACFKLLHKTLI